MFNNYGKDMKSNSRNQGTSQTSRKIVNNKRLTQVTNNRAQKLSKNQVRKQTQSNQKFK